MAWAQVDAGDGAVRRHQRLVTAPHVIDDDGDDLSVLSRPAGGGVVGLLSRAGARRRRHLLREQGSRLLHAHSGAGSPLPLFRSGQHVQLATMGHSAYAEGGGVLAPPLRRSSTAAAATAGQRDPREDSTQEAQETQPLVVGEVVQVDVEGGRVRVRVSQLSWHEIL